jgi:signal transduction histidine kinase
MCRRSGPRPMTSGTWIPPHPVRRIHAVPSRLEAGAFRLLAVTGVLLWLLVLAGPFMAVLGWAPPRTLPRRPHLFMLAWGGWGLAFWYTAVRQVSSLRLMRALLLAQSACAMALAALGTGGAESGLLVAVAGQAPFVLSFRGSLALAAVQTAAVAAVMVLWTNAHAALLATLGMATFQAFAVSVAYLAVNAAQAREESERLNAELQAAQGLLADSARLGERLRISRDLHDTLGHHLTALSLNLEAAAHLAGPPAREHVLKAQAMARHLLGEVREVVEAVREQRGFDLARSLTELAAGVPRPRVHLRVPAGLDIDDAERARVLFRCVQEVVTNAARHSGAANLWIELTHGGQGTTVVAHDDGHGAREPALGHGLLGMRERLEQAGGRLEIEAAAGRGFEVRAFLPGPAAQA